MHFDLFIAALLVKNQADSLPSPGNLKVVGILLGYLCLYDPKKMIVLNKYINQYNQLRSTQITNISYYATGRFVLQAFPPSNSSVPQCCWIHQDQL